MLQHIVSVRARMGKQMNPRVLTVGFPYAVFKLELAQLQGWTTGLDVPQSPAWAVSAGRSLRAQFSNCTL